MIVYSHTFTRWRR